MSCVFRGTLSPWNQLLLWIWKRFNVTEIVNWKRCPSISTNPTSPTLKKNFFAIRFVWPIGQVGMPRGQHDVPAFIQYCSVNRAHPKQWFNSFSDSVDYHLLPLKAGCSVYYHLTVGVLRCPEISRWFSVSNIHCNSIHSQVEDMRTTQGPRISLKGNSKRLFYLQTLLSWRFAVLYVKIANFPPRRFKGPYQVAFTSHLLQLLTRTASLSRSQNPEKCQRTNITFLLLTMFATPARGPHAKRDLFLLWAL
jgi:hypothetical protein